MSLTLQELSDRIEIEELFTRYCYAIDSRDWDTFRTLFGKDAVIDDTVTGGIKSGVEEHITYLDQALKKVSMSRHTISTILIDLDGNNATCRTQCFCSMQVLIDSKTQTFFLGVCYKDKVARQQDSWRIQERIETDFWHYNVPEGFTFQ